MTRIALKVIARHVTEHYNLLAHVLLLGVLVFQQEGSPAAITESTRILEVFVSGDSCIGLVTLLQKSPIERPMALDILWQVGRAIGATAA